MIHKERRLKGKAAPRFIWYCFFSPSKATSLRRQKVGQKKTGLFVPAEGKKPPLYYQVVNNQIVKHAIKSWWHRLLLLSWSRICAQDLERTHFIQALIGSKAKVAVESNSVMASWCWSWAGGCPHGNIVRVCSTRNNASWASFLSLLLYFPKINENHQAMHTSLDSFDFDLAH